MTASSLVSHLNNIHKTSRNRLDNALLTLNFHNANEKGKTPQKDIGQ